MISWLVLAVAMVSAVSASGTVTDVAATVPAVSADGTVADVAASQPALAASAVDVAVASVVNVALPTASVVSSASDFVLATTSSFSCSAPPPSLEICLSSVFSEIEAGIVSIEATLQANEGPIQQEIHHEHTLLTDEISWVRVVESIASEVESAVFIDYQAVEQQQINLQYELEYINKLYGFEVQILAELEANIQEIVEEEHEIVVEYEKIKGEKWSLYSAISAIVYEKLVIEQEQGEIQKVIGELNQQLALIYVKISQLNKRQGWLLSWENKLSIDVHELESDIASFRVVEVDLYYRELSLYAEQLVLKQKVVYVESCLESLEEEYSAVVEQLLHIQGYQALLLSVQSSVSSEVSVFVYAYEDFTCEDSLLYYEACSSVHGVALDAIPAEPVEAVESSTESSE